MDSDAPTSKLLGICRHCSNEAANSRCKGCLEGLDEDGQLLETYYCNSDCQKADWSAHKLLCKHLRARKQLYRAGETVQAAFYAYRERLFDILIAKVEKRGKDIYVWEGQYNLGQVLAKFPKELVPDMKDKQTVLTYLACGDANGYMHDLVKKSLEGIYLDIKEVSIKSKGHRRQVVFHHGDGTRDTATFFHEILRVTLIDGSVYAFDVASAQHGHYEPVIPWDKYVKKRVASIRAINDFGDQKRVLDSLKASENTMRAAVHLTHRQAVRCLDDSIDKWLQKQKTTLSELLKAPKEDYQEKSSKFLAYIAKGVADFLDWADRRGGVVKVGASWV